MLPLDSPFWKFSLRVYARPEVAAECLELQDKLGVNINVLLFGCWIAASRRVALSAADVRWLESEIENWHRLAVLPLRELRDSLKPASEMQYQAVQSFRREILACELRAEQIEQALLFQRAERLSGRAGAGQIRNIITDNIELIRSLSPIPPTAEMPVSALIEASLASAET